MIHNYVYWHKVFNYLSRYNAKVFRVIPLSWYSSRGGNRTIHKSDFKSVLSRVLGVISPTCFDNTDEDTRICIIENADKTIGRYFECLGSGPVQMNPIDWHTDFINKHSWPQGLYYSKQRAVYGEGDGADIKVPWELSRCHFLLWLGEAFLLTKDEKYAKDIVRIISEWIDENPLMHSVNWTCAMDVAIRAVNWMYALNMIIESAAMTDDFTNKVYRSLYQHGFFIYHHMEKGVPYSNNHYAADLAGLLYLSQLFIDTKRGKKWWSFALNEYYYEIRRQVLPSGMQFERSFSYHRLMTELFAYPFFMIKRVGEIVPVDIEHRLTSMYLFVAQYTVPNRYAPTIADNDDGRFLPFVKQDFRDHGYLINNDSLDSKMVRNGIEPLYQNEAPAGCSCHEDAGYAFLRKGKGFLIVSNGGFSSYPTGKQTVGTHTHNDNLSFVFSLENEELFVDPGSYVYTANPKMCNEFRSTRKHNTIVVDDEEQNGLHLENVFLLTKNTQIGRIFVHEEDDLCKCESQYKTINEEMNHERWFVLADSFLSIQDKIIKRGNDHRVELSFHLSPQVTANIIDLDKIRLSTVGYEIEMQFVAPKPFSIAVVVDSVSPSYGVIKESKTLRMSSQFNNSLDIKTNITWKKR